MDTPRDSVTPTPAALLAAQRPNVPEAKPKLTPAGFAKLIREGAALRPQAFGAYYSGRADFCSCAIGAAVEASIGLQAIAPEPAVAISWMDRNENVELMYLNIVNPVKTHYAEPLWGVVAWLNDTAKWTREQIADWLESADVADTYSAAFGG